MTLASPAAAAAESGMPDHPTAANLLHIIELLRAELWRARDVNARLAGELDALTAGGQFDRENRRAALNLMEDAVQARGAAQHEVDERARAEAALLSSEQRQASLLQLSEKLRPLADPGAVLTTASRLLGEQLGVQRVTFAEIDGDDLIVQSGYANGVEPLAGRHPLVACGAEVAAAARRGESIAVADVAADPLFSDAERAVYQAAQIAAFAGVALKKGDRLAAGVGVQSAVPRQWSAADLKLIRDIGERMWDALERARSETARRASETTFRTLGEAVPDFLWMSDASGGPIYQNPAWHKYTGLTSDDLARDGWQQLCHPDDRPALMEVWEQALRWKKSFEVEFRCRRRDGVHRWFHTRAVPIRDEAGRLVKWVGVTADIHERKRTEEMLREADRRKDEFLATLAHELRNPLAPIRNSLHILRLGGRDDQIYDTLDRQVNHLVRLVDELMEVSRITRGAIELKREPAALADAVRGAVEISQPMIERAGHRLTIDLPAEPLTLLADPVRLTQILANLLNNAAKFTEAGGQIWLSVRREGSDAVISIRDTGIGIPPEMINRVFDLFCQVDRSLARSQGGLGIGLSLVHSLVELHGGRIEARSAGAGNGSEFIVTMPLAPGPAARVAPPAESNGPAVIGPRRILVVDDNRDAGETLGQLLEILGAQVRVAGNGRDALQLINDYHPSVVLMDIGMPEMDGHEVARQARRTPAGRDATLIALTGWGQAEDRRQSREAGFNHHLVKPVDLEELQSLLASLPAEKETAH